MDLRRLRASISLASRRTSWLPLLAIRLCVGVVFLTSGWGKVQDLGKVTGFFTELGIPAPAFNAALVGYSELICGALLIVGLATRLATIPLIVTMIVALATAKSSEIKGITDLFGLVELTYAVMLLVVLVMGPGAASLDVAIARAIDKRRREAPPDLEVGIARYV